MVLTAIVITLGMTAFLLALAYRSWQLSATTRSRTTWRTAGSCRAPSATTAARRLDQDGDGARTTTGAVDDRRVAAATRPGGAR